MNLFRKTLGILKDFWRWHQMQLKQFKHTRTALIVNERVSKAPNGSVKIGDLRLKLLLHTQTIEIYGLIPVVGTQPGLIVRPSLYKQPLIQRTLHTVSLNLQL